MSFYGVRFGSLLCRLICFVGVTAVLVNSASAGVITGETATASSFYAGDDRAPIHAVDDSKLVDATTTPSPTGPYHQGGGAGGYMWMSNNGGADLLPWITIDLGDVYDITSISVWNYNESGGNAQGMKDATIRYSTTTGGAPTGADNLLGSYVFTQAPGLSPGDTADVLSVNFTARYVKIKADSNYGSGNATGLSEVQFIGTLVVPEPSSIALMGFGSVFMIGLLYKKRATSERTINLAG